MVALARRPPPPVPTPASNRAPPARAPFRGSRDPATDCPLCLCASSVCRRLHARLSSRTARVQTLQHTAPRGRVRTWESWTATVMVECLSLICSVGRSPCWLLKVMYALWLAEHRALLVFSNVTVTASIVARACRASLTDSALPSCASCAVVSPRNSSRNLLASTALATVQMIVWTSSLCPVVSGSSPSRQVRWLQS